MVRLDTPTKRARIVTLKDQGVSSAKIAREFGGSKSQVNRLYQKWKGKSSFYECLLQNGKASDVMDLRPFFSSHLTLNTPSKPSCSWSPWFPTQKGPLNLQTEPS
ncbi:hypothetical protein GGU11DRAFT_749671 [Lentinula aff. detonsa]|nr:hypothetical protein GGU11DRAFT_749671 [Lentinula aff. detonsa]